MPQRVNTGASFGAPRPPAEEERAGAFMVAQASRLCCEQSVFSLTGETPVPRLCYAYLVNSSFGECAGNVYCPA